MLPIVPCVVSRVLLLELLVTPPVVPPVTPLLRSSAVWPVGAPVPLVLCSSPVRPVVAPVLPDCRPLPSLVWVTPAPVDVCSVPGPTGLAVADGAAPVSSAGDRPALESRRSACFSLLAMPCEADVASE